MKITSKVYSVLTLLLLMACGGSDSSTDDTPPPPAVAAPSAATLVFGNLIIYVTGLFWLARFVGESRVLQMGLFPFLVGDLLKIILGIILIGGTDLLFSKNKSTGRLV